MRSAPAAFIQPRLSLAACLVGVLLTACGGSDDPVDGATHAIGGTLTVHDWPAGWVLTSTR